MLMTKHTAPVLVALHKALVAMPLNPAQHESAAKYVRAQLQCATSQARILLGMLMCASLLGLYLILIPGQAASHAAVRSPVRDLLLLGEGLVLLSQAGLIIHYQWRRNWHERALRGAADLPPQAYQALLRFRADLDRVIFLRLFTRKPRHPSGT